MFPLLLMMMAIGPAETVPSAPTAMPPPAPLVVSGSISRGRLTMLCTRNKPVEVEYREKVTVDRFTYDVSRFVTRLVPVSQMFKVDLKDATIMTAGGKRLTLAEAEKRLKKPAGLVLSMDGKPIGRGHRAMLQADAVVIILPTSALADLFEPRKGPLPKDVED